MSGSLAVIVTSPDGKTAHIGIVRIGSYVAMTAAPLIMDATRADRQEVLVLAETLLDEHEQGCLFVEGRSGWTVETVTA